jgi:hypothetical protein
VEKVFLNGPRVTSQAIWQPFQSFCRSVRLRIASIRSQVQGYHIQITARSDRDLTPDGIIQKVADASGSKYSGAVASRDAPPAPVASKPVFLPTRVASGSSGFNPLGSRPRPSGTGAVDDDGWGADAPQVTRTQLEKVPSAYQPTRVNMAELTAQKQPISQFTPPPRVDDDSGDVVKGGYQPIGKVNIAEIRAKAKESGQARDDRPTVVKGSYEPIGKVDIAAIRAKAQPSVASQEPEEEEPTRSLPDRSASFQTSERLTSLPKPRVASKFGGSSSFAGTKAPVPSGFTPISNPTAAPVGIASKTFADEGGKTPAQIWAEKKARQSGGFVSPSTTGPGVSAPVQSQTSGDGGWKSGYSGKSWAPVHTTKTGQSTGSNTAAANDMDFHSADEGPTESVGSIRERFSQAPPPMDIGSKPNASRSVPPPPQEEVRPSSPIRVAMPVARSAHEEEEPQPAPRAVPAEPTPKAAPAPNTAKGGKRALVQYDYEKAEDNEIELKEGDYVTNIEMVDDDWWMGQNTIGETGLFPANYVELVEEEEPPAGVRTPHREHRGVHNEPPAAHAEEEGQTATATYDYEAAEDNELSFPDGAKITGVVSISSSFNWIMS